MKAKAAGKLPNETSIAIGARVKDARVQAGLTQEALGNAIGVTFQQIQKYERGTNRVASDRLPRIAEALGKPITFFYSAAASSIPPADDVLLTLVIQSLGEGTGRRRMLAALPAIRDNDVDLAAAFLERLARGDRT
jgi:transcriptional regulator with XRE-family HTH domain